MISLLPILIGVQLSSVHVVSVPGGLGSAKRIQAAVDACPKEGCLIQLPDAEYAMENMVWIRKRTDIQLTGTGIQPPHLVWDDSLLVPDTSGTAKLFDLVPYPDSSRQTPPKGWLRWPDTLQPNIPGSVSDTTNEFSGTGFQHGGMFVVDLSQRIRFERLHLDGRKTAAFKGSGINWLLLHGSVGISLFQSLAVDIVECELDRFWSAIYSTEWNDKCSIWNGAWSSTVPATAWSACGKMGGHLVERNRIHDNWYGFYSNSGLDQGSVLRENLAWNNANQYLVDPAKSVTPHSMIGTKATLSTTLQDIPGGFLMISNSLFPVHVLSHNTIVDAPLPYVVDGGGRALPNALWVDNIFDLHDSVGTTRISTYQWIPSSELNANHFWNNLVRHRTAGYFTSIYQITLSDTTVTETWMELAPKDTVGGTQTGGRQLLVPKDTIDGTVRYDTFSIFYDTTFKDYTTKNVNADPTFQLLRPWPLLQPRSGEFPILQIPGIRKTISVKTMPGQRYTVSQWFPNNIDSMGLAGIALSDTATATAILRGNRICRDCPFVSTDPASPSFLVPSARSRQVDSALAGRGTFRSDIGALDTAGGTSTRAPLRVRATGMPNYDKTRKQLLLPVRMLTENVKLDKIFAWRFSVTSGNLDPSRPGGTLKEANLAPTGPIPELAVTDSVIRIPLVPGANDSLIQVDLWLGGIAGTDTIAGTPMSWVWFSRAKGSTFQTATTSPHVATSPRWNLSGRRLRIDASSVPEAGTELLLVDARGRTAQLEPIRAGDFWEYDLSRLTRGIWIARFASSPAWILRNL